MPGAEVCYQSEAGISLESTDVANACAERRGNESKHMKYSDGKRLGWEIALNLEMMVGGLLRSVSH